MQTKKALIIQTFLGSFIKKWLHLFRLFSFNEMAECFIALENTIPEEISLKLIGCL